MLELLKTRRSIRQYESKEVEKEKVDAIIKGALMAPSSRGRRPWEFIVVTDKALLGKLAECRSHSSQFLKGAPLGIVVIADPEVCDVWIEDASIAAIIMQLTAHSLGLGSCWIQVRGRNHAEDVSVEQYIKELLHIPEQYHVECIIAAGYPAETKALANEETLYYSKVHTNKYMIKESKI